MFILNGKKTKRIFIVFILACFFVLCSCHKQVEEPQETYSITYVINGHGEQPEYITDQTNLPDPLPVLSEEGWTFEGWYITATYEEGSEAVAGTELIEDITLYAKWTKVDVPTPSIPKKYCITFVTNGHGEQPKNLTEQVYIPNSLPVLREEGWRFGGWYITATYEEGSEAVAGTELIEDITLYAKWTEIVPFYVVNYEIKNTEAGTLIGETRQIVYRGDDTTPVTVVPNAGYKFLGWTRTGSYTDELERVDELTRVDTDVQNNIIAIAMFEGPITCYMDFRATKGGRVEGLLKQEVLYGESGEPVTAIPDEGFRFIRWSDGKTDAIRTNEYVTYSGNTIYAEFERCERTFKLEYNEATSNNELTKYTFYLDDMEQKQYLPIPQREGYEFMGWYSDWFYTIQVTDRKGKMIVDRDWFNNDYYFEPDTNPNMKLFARWKPIKEVPVYKILLIFVTEVHATLESNHNGMMKVDYIMSAFEKAICSQITLQTERYLEALLNGTVDFQIDSYFTRQSLTENNFYQGKTTPLGGSRVQYDYGIDLKSGQLPEVNHMLDKYDSIIASFSLNDSTIGNFHVTAGHSGAKYGNMHLETVFPDKESEFEFDYSYPGVYRMWIGNMNFYIHEFTHTVELQLKQEDFYGIHAINTYLSEMGVEINTEFDYLRDYFKNEFNIGDRNVGIPYEFWTGEYERK